MNHNYNNGSHNAETGNSETITVTTQHSELEILREECQKTMDALIQLAEGVRIVTRQMKQQQKYSPEEYNYDHSIETNFEEEEEEELTTELPPLRSRTFSSSETTTASFSSSILPSDDDKQLNDITQSLDGTGFGADLVGLSLTANMINERVRLATNEASILTEDMTSANRTTNDALDQSQKAIQTAKKKYKENKRLKSQLEYLKLERKVLCREVKTLRKENNYLKNLEHESKRQEILLALEQHIHGALQIHEQQLLPISKSNCTSQNTVRIESPDDLISSDDESEESKPNIFHSILYASSSMNQKANHNHTERRHISKKVDKRKKNVKAKISLMMPTSKEDNDTTQNLTPKKNNKLQTYGDYDDTKYHTKTHNSNSFGSYSTEQTTATIDIENKMETTIKKQVTNLNNSEEIEERLPKRLGISQTKIPPTVTVDDSPAVILSPLPGNASPIGLSLGCLLCDEKILRSLAFPEDMVSPFIPSI